MYTHLICILILLFFCRRSTMSLLGLFLFSGIFETQTQHDTNGNAVNHNCARINSEYGNHAAFAWHSQHTRTRSDNSAKIREILLMI